MSFPRDLDEYTIDELIEELRRRQRALAQEQCPYCQRSLSGPACRYPEQHRANVMIARFVAHADAHPDEPRAPFQPGQLVLIKGPASEADGLNAVSSDGRADLVWPEEIQPVQRPAAQRKCRTCGYPRWGCGCISFDAPPPDWGYPKLKGGGAE